MGDAVVGVAVGVCVGAAHAAIATTVVPQLLQAAAGGKVIVCTAVPVNAFKPMLAVEAQSKVAVVRTAQSSNAEAPTEITVAGTVTLFSTEHPLKALSAICVQLVGTSTCPLASTGRAQPCTVGDAVGAHVASVTRTPHWSQTAVDGKEMDCAAIPWNALLLIWTVLRQPASKITIFRAEQLLKAYMEILVTDAGIVMDVSAVLANMFQYILVN